MTNSGTVNGDKARKRPLVWVKELVLYKSIEPLIEIRRMPFSMGMNIIQGEVSESTEPFESGHGIGKTTVCRLIRYCLGEKTFGQAHVLEEVKHCLPSSYVGAIIELDGEEWSILRPLGVRRKHLAQQGVSLTDLATSKAAQKFEEFIDAVETAVLAGLMQREVLTNGQPVQWPHILAMCSRDQESRYDRFWNWRHSRSQSSTPKFSKPKVDASLCVRAVLGLLDPKERELRAKLEELEESLPILRADIKKKEEEPRFHIDRLRKTLARDFGVDEATDGPIDADEMFGVSQAATRRLTELQNELAGINKWMPDLDRQISVASASFLEHSEMSDQHEAASEATADGTEALLDDLDKLRNRRQTIEDKRYSLCPAGGSLVGDCEIVQARITELDRLLADQQQEVLPEVAGREQVAAELSERADRQKPALEKMRETLDRLNREKNDLLEHRYVLNELIRQLPVVSAELEKWNGILEETTSHEELDSLREQAKAAEKGIESAQAKLKAFVEKQRIRGESFASRFNDIVKHTINDEFKGVVDIAEDGVSFRINRGNSLFGEAYETLAVLLADIAILAESLSPGIHHPGFLLHDSPREADLNVRIYERLLEVASSMMTDARDGGDVPYQYIVTTTTPPPDGLIDETVTLHTLSGGKGSLFGMQLESGSAESGQQTLFDTEGDE